MADPPPRTSAFPIRSSPRLRRRPVHFGLTAAIKARQPVPRPPAWVRQRREHDRRAVGGTGRLLVHQMLVRHAEKGGVVPRGSRGFPPGQSSLPSAPLAPDGKGFHSVPDTRDIRGLDRTRAARAGTGDSLVLERPDELLVAGHLLGYPIGQPSSDPIAEPGRGPWVPLTGS